MSVCAISAAIMDIVLLDHVHVLHMVLRSRPRLRRVLRVILYLVKIIATLDCVVMLVITGIALPRHALLDPPFWGVFVV
jgi:hypothetical protein